jgi:hypothetical protein
MSKFATRKVGSLIMGAISILGLSSLLGVAPAQAGSMSLGDWETFGDVSVVSGQARLSTNGLMMDDSPAPDSSFNFSGNAAMAVGVPGGLEEFLGLSLGSLDPDLSQVAYEGSAIQKMLSVQAGDILSFDWNFLSNDQDLGFGFGDYAFVAIDGAITPLADVVNTPFSPSSLFQRETGKSTFLYRFERSGQYNIGLGAVDVGDFSVTSALSLSNFQIQTQPVASVPEPTSLLSLLFIGSISGASILKSKKYQ